MELKDIKKGLFGYNKNSVIEYVSELNHSCAEKVEEVRREKTEALFGLGKTNKELNDKIVCLEAETDALKKQLAEKEKVIIEFSDEIEQYKNNTEARKMLEKEVADILNDAHEFAKLMREKTIRENETLRLENKKANDAIKEKLAEYRKNVCDIKLFIDSVLKNTRNEFNTAEETIAVLERKVDE